MDDMLRKALRGFLGLLKQLLTNLLGDDGETWEAELKKFLRKEPCWVGATKPTTPSVDLADFFTTRLGLWISEGFHRRILIPALAMEETAPASVGKPFDLPVDMYDVRIRKELGVRYVFENTRAFLKALAMLIEHQWGGKEGDLTTNNACGSLFYVLGREEGEGDLEVFTVCVRLDTDDGSWSVGAYAPIANRWNAGCRAFPRGDVKKAA